eukprot:6206022-Pleurochrysis_carterae.AAC.1
MMLTVVVSKCLAADQVKACDETEGSATRTAEIAAQAQEKAATHSTKFGATASVVSSACYLVDLVVVL